MTKHGYKAVNQVANSQKIGESAGEGPILGLFQLAVFRLMCPRLGWNCLDTRWLARMSLLRFLVCSGTIESIGDVRLISHDIPN